MMKEVVPTNFNELVKEKLEAAGYEVSKPFTWRTRDGLFIKVSDMNTGHLFNTLKMIWNNTVKPEFRVGGNVRLYRFGKYYSRDYIRAAVKAMIHELSIRPLNPTQEKLIQDMAKTSQELGQAIEAPSKNIEQDNQTK